MVTPESHENSAKNGPNSLAALLENSLEVIYLESGRIRGDGVLPWTVRPFTVMSQTSDPGCFQVEGEEPMTIPAGGGCIMPEGVRFKGLDPYVMREVKWAHFRFRILGELDLFHLIQSPYVVDAQVADRMTGLSRKLAVVQEETTRPLMVQVCERRRLCSEIVCLIVSVCDPRPGAAQAIATISRIIPVLRFMREQLARPIFLAELAQVVGLSPTRFDVVFRKATRQTPLQYLTHLRIKRAQELLLSTEQSVNEIGQAVGFRDAFHFSKTFKRYSGAAPKNYRLGAGASTTPSR